MNAFLFCPSADQLCEMVPYVWVGGSYFIYASNSSCTVWKYLDMNFLLFYERLKTWKYGFQFQCIYMFICLCFFSRSQASPVDIYPYTHISHPPSPPFLQPPFEASVYMTLEIGGYCKLFDTNIFLSLHHLKSKSASFDSVTLHSKLPFDFFSAYVLHLSSAL